MRDLLSLVLASPESFSSNISPPFLNSTRLHTSLILPGWINQHVCFLDVTISLDLFGYHLHPFQSDLNTLSKIKILNLKTIFSEDSLTNLTSHGSEKHGLSNTSVGKIQFLCNVNSIGFQNDSTSKLFHHLQCILTDRIPRPEDKLFKLREGKKYRNHTGFRASYQF